MGPREPLRKTPAQTMGTTTGTTGNHYPRQRGNRVPLLVREPVHSLSPQQVTGWTEPSPNTKPKPATHPTPNPTTSNDQRHNDQTTLHQLRHPNHQHPMPQLHTTHRPPTPTSQRQPLRPRTPSTTPRLETPRRNRPHQLHPLRNTHRTQRHLGPRPPTRRLPPRPHPMQQPSRRTRTTMTTQALRNPHSHPNTPIFYEPHTHQYPC